MRTVENGSVITVCYRGLLDDRKEEQELQGNCQRVDLEIGSGEVMKGFEENLLGMTPKERKTFTLQPQEAFGTRDERLIRTFSRSELPFEFEAREGEMVALQTHNGEQILALVKDADSDSVTLDMNHPLAGKTVTFEVEVEEIRA